MPFGRSNIPKSFQWKQLESQCQRTLVSQLIWMHWKRILTKNGHTTVATVVHLTSVYSQFHLFKFLFAAPSYEFPENGKCISCGIKWPYDSLYATQRRCWMYKRQRERMIHLPEFCSPPYDAMIGCPHDWCPQVEFRPEQLPTIGTSRWHLGHHPLSNTPGGWRIKLDDRFGGE